MWQNDYLVYDLKFFHNFLLYFLSTLDPGILKMTWQFFFKYADTYQTHTLHANFTNRKKSIIYFEISKLQTVLRYLWQQPVLRYLWQQTKKFRTNKIFLILKCLWLVRYREHHDVRLERVPLGVGNPSF